MTYINAIRLIFSKMYSEHREKGESFRDMTTEEVENLLLEEINEWKFATGRLGKIEELCDIAICAILNIEKITGDD